MNCRYDKTVPQLLIRWSVQRNYITIPKSTKPERILENAKVFDFTINDKDMRTLVGFIAPVDYPMECKCCMYLKDVWVFFRLQQCIFGVEHLQLIKVEFCGDES